MSLKSAEIQEQIKSLTTAIDEGMRSEPRASDAQLSLWEMQRKDVQDQLKAALADETQQQERIDAQAEKIEAITLPYDYNEILGNPMANETIIENVKQFQLQAYEEHNVEVARLNEQFKARFDELFKGSIDAVSQWREEEGLLRSEIESERHWRATFERLADEEKARADQYQHDLYQSDLDKKEAETTRDNAVRISEEVTAAAELLGKENAELKEQIEALKQELTTKKAITVSGNEKLAELAAKAKESTAAAAQRGIDRWNQQYGMDIPVLEVPDVPPVNPVTEEEAPAQENSFPAEIQSTESTVVEGSSNGDREVGTEESEVIPFTRHHDAMIVGLEEMVKELNYRMDQHESKQAVA